jgi:sortase A
MIDFLHPKSNSRNSFIFALLALLLMGAGFYLVFRPLQPIISGVDDQYSILPDNPNPEELDGFIVSNLHLPVNTIKEMSALAVAPETDVNVKSDKPQVLGVSYNKQARKNLSAVAKNVNRIIIPKMGVDTEILEGQTADTLWKGVWHMPVGSTPNKGGNTIITAHRYLYRPPSSKTFYLLDKLEPGDKIVIYWDGKKYEYQVTDSKVVEPSAVEILHNTSDKRLTLFSCTPLFTSQKRLVVTAKPI